ALGYRYDPAASEVEPKPLELPVDAAARVRRTLERLPSYGASEHGPLLCRTEVVQGVSTALGLPALDEAQAEVLLTRGVVGRELVRRGYQTTALWVNGRHLAPAREGYDYYLPRVLSVPATPQRVMWAEGFRVHLPLLVRDGETVVYLELVGPRQAVHANWAALRTYNRVFHVAGARLSTCKEDGLTTLKATLPSGWDHWCLIHRQASCAQMTPGQPFYLVDLNLAPIPATFFPFLSHALSLPLLAGWTEYLWVEGRLRGLVQPLSVGCIGAGGWRVHADDTAGWEAIVSEGLRERLLLWEETAYLTDQTQREEPSLAPSHPT
ncbi:MAG: hypothetical protein H0T73_02575, partial [Ardenticatenales bacterium]|nr:hypothetical protein [Ardenticatenales bacterium]